MAEQIWLQLHLLKLEKPENSWDIPKIGVQILWVIVPHWQGKAVPFLHMEEQIIWIPTSWKRAVIKSVNRTHSLAILPFMIITIITGSDHVEIVYQVSGSTVKTFGGNTGSTGSYSTNKVSSPRTYGNILYIIRPNYNNISNNKWYESYSLANLRLKFFCLCQQCYNWRILEQWRLECSCLSGWQTETTALEF